MKQALSQIAFAVAEHDEKIELCARQCEQIGQAISRFLD